MRLLLLNPNTTTALTERLAASVRHVLPPGARIEAITAPRGFPYISSRAEAQIAGGLVLEMMAERVGTFDAAVIAAFGDPGLHAARELFDLPVSAMAEGAMLAALPLGRRFAFVTFARRLLPWYEEQVSLAGLENRFAGTFVPDAALGDIAKVAEDLREVLAETCQRAAQHADVLILAGAPIAGLAGEIADDIPAILIDPVQAAALQAILQAQLSPRGAHAGSFARPPAKDSTGLSHALGEWIAGGR